MNILYISQYFPPEAGATQARAWEMTRHLAGRGHRVTVLCNLPNHPAGEMRPAYRHRWRSVETQDGVHIIRTWVYARPRRNRRVRAAFYISFFFSSLAAGWNLSGPFDLVYATSPPPLAGLVGWLLARRFRCKFVYEVRDLWLEMARELNMVRRRPLIFAAERFDHLLYGRADAIVAVTRGIRERLAEKGLAGKLRLIHNGANPDEFSDRGQDLKSRLGYDGRFVVLYAGVLGLAQGIDSILELVERFRGVASVQFVMIGQGPLRPLVEKWQKRHATLNFTLLDEIPREQMAGYFSMADCGLVPLKKRSLFLGALPTKMFDCWACSRPVILSVDGEARKELEACGGGVYVEPENIEAMAGAIRFLQAHPRQRRRMGMAGRAHVVAHFSRRAAAEALEKALQEVAAGRASSASPCRRRQRRG